MFERMIPASKVEKIADWLWGGDMLANGGRDEEIAPQLAARAEMAGQWRLADHKDYGRVLVTNTTPDRNGYVYFVFPSDRDFARFHWASCTPDKLTYIDQKADPAPALPEGWRLADHQKYGRVLVTNTIPNSDGRVYFMFAAADPLGHDWASCTPDGLTYIGTDP